MTNVKGKDYGYVCTEDGCGSVSWVMRKGNRLECSKCQSVIENVAWVEHSVKIKKALTNDSGDLW